jgi:Bacterial Ig-like domain
MNSIQQSRDQRPNTSDSSVSSQNRGVFTIEGCSGVSRPTFGGSMNLSIAAKFGLPAIALAGVLVACPTTPVEPTKTTFSVSPTDKATNVVETANVVLTFSAAMPDAAKSVVSLKDGATIVDAKATWDTAKKILTVDPTNALGFSKTYTVAVTATKDAAGVEVAAKSTTFTVKADPNVGGGGVKVSTLLYDGSIAYDAPTATTTAKYAFFNSSSVVGTFGVGSLNDAVSRGVLRFTLPAGVTAAQVKTATLDLTQKAVVGSPYTAQGGLQVYAAGFGTMFTDAAPSTPTIKASYESGTTLFSGPTAEPATVDGGKVSVDVTAYVLAQLAVTPTSNTADLLVRFKTEVAGQTPYVRFYSSEAAAADAAKKPALTITLK